MALSAAHTTHKITTLKIHLEGFMETFWLTSFVLNWFNFGLFFGFCFPKQNFIQQPFVFFLLPKLDKARFFPLLKKLIFSAWYYWHSRHQGNPAPRSLSFAVCFLFIYTFGGTSLSLQLYTHFHTSFRRSQHSVHTTHYTTQYSTWVFPLSYTNKRYYRHIYNNGHYRLV